MSAPKVMRASVEVNFTTSSGYQSRAGWKDPGTRALQWGLREIVRVMTINGDDELVNQIVKEAMDATKDDIAANVISKEPR